MRFFQPSFRNSAAKILPLKVKTVLDGFSGTTRVFQALKQSGYTVYANDIADWSKVFGECY
ncbi:DNA adenine methylase, partial [Patescibacteria group bacterium]|nr:DNA adenine methylase [Patescibacteria group bacterium]